MTLRRSKTTHTKPALPHPGLEALHLGLAQRLGPSEALELRLLEPELGLRLLLLLLGLRRGLHRLAETRRASRCIHGVASEGFAADASLYDRVRPSYPALGVAHALGAPLSALTCPSVRFMIFIR